MSTQRRVSKVRKQILLTEANVAYLEAEAIRTGLSQSDIVRRLLDDKEERTKRATKQLNN